jgi:glycosyl transferase, family 25
MRDEEKEELKDIFLISIQGMERTPSKTRNFLESLPSEWSVHTLGIDLRKSTLSDIASKVNLKYLTFIAGGQLSPGELGCYLSHQKVYRAMIDRGISQALVLEDDTELVGNSCELIAALENCSESNFELVSFYSEGGGILLSRRSKPVYSAPVPPVSTLAYWITLQGAKKLYNEVEISGTADWPFQIARVKVGAMKTKLVAHANGLQSIDEFSSSHRPINRVHLSVRPLRVLIGQFKWENYDYLFKNYGAFVTFKQLLFFRVVKKITKLVKFGRIEGNSTVILWS